MLYRTNRALASVPVYSTPEYSPASPAPSAEYTPAATPDETPTIIYKLGKSRVINMAENQSLLEELSCGICLNIIWDAERVRFNSLIDNILVN